MERADLEIWSMLLKRAAARPRHEVPPDVALAFDALAAEIDDHLAGIDARHSPREGE